MSFHMKTSHKSLSSVISSLQPLRFQKCNLKFASTHVRIFIKLRTYVPCHLRPSQWRTSEIPLISNTNTIGVKLLRCYPQYYVNAWTDRHETWYVCHATLARLNGVLEKSLPLVTSILKTSQFGEVVTWMSETVFMKLGMYIMPSDVFSAVYLVNQSLQQ
jgi:hypothetical protein